MCIYIYIGIIYIYYILYTQLEVDKKELEN